MLLSFAVDFHFRHCLPSKALSAVTYVKENDGARPLPLQTSWDFMEPICYFIGAAYAIVGYSFYMATKKEPDNSKVWTQLIKGRREKVYQKLLKDST